MLKIENNYESCLSIDLRCFDNGKSDYGVGDFLDNLGFTPDKLFNHETYVDQLHIHKGVIDDQYLEPQWVSQRAIPGAKCWTRRQFKGLIDSLHKHGIQIYQGAEAAWSYWPEYGEINKCNYIYDHLSDLFILHDNGRSSQEARGAINPLRRFQDGTYYEDLLIQDLLNFLNDYEMDGFFAADGFAGSDCTLAHGDFSEDMLKQFEEYTNISVPRDNLADIVYFLLTEHAYEWAVFYADRWAAFYLKVTTALNKAKYDLVIFTPWTKGPAESLLTYGIDYGKLFKAGVRTMCLEVMEEVIGRRWHSNSAIECNGIVSAITAKLQAPGLKIIWTAATANIPEHWHTFRDLPNIIEREALSLFSARAVLPDGSSVKAFDGYLTIFGIDLEKNEWQFFKNRVAIGNSFDVARSLGLGILWSDNILYEHTKRGEIWPISQVVTQLHYSGIPVQTGCRIKDIQLADNISGFLLVDPVGISDEELDCLESAVNNGAMLTITGRIESKRLMYIAGLSSINSPSTGKWKCLNDKELWMQGIPERESSYTITNLNYGSNRAEVFISDGDSVLVSRLGKVVYLGITRESFPSFGMPKTKAELDCDQPVIIKSDDQAYTIRKAVETLARYHPDSLELIAARVIGNTIEGLPLIDKGQYYGHINSNGKMVLLLENCMNTFYIISEILLPKNKSYIQELPIRRLGPLGYIYWDHSEDSFTVTIPPDAAIPCEINFRE